MKVELTKEDWEQAKDGAIDLLKNAMAQVIVYKGQLEVAERELAKFPPTPAVSAPKKTPVGVS